MVDKQKFTPGPWEAKDYRVFNDFKNLPIKSVCFTATNNAGRTAENEANAHLIAQAPAQELVLQLLMAGKARFERSGSLVEFCFGGMRYSVEDEPGWNCLLSNIGWDKARAALASVSAPSPSEPAA